MILKQLIELYDILDSPTASGQAAVEYLRSIDHACDAGARRDPTAGAQGLLNVMHHAILQRHQLEPLKLNGAGPLLNGVLARHLVGDGDVLPKAPPLISRVRGCQDALTGGVAQRAWQHRRASARLFHYAVAHGCNRRAMSSALPAHG